MREVKVKTVKAEKVVQVYRGRPGCMCGCRGRYTFAEGTNLHEAGKRRGYAVTAEEVSQRRVQNVVRAMNRLGGIKVEGRCAYVETETTTYAAYFSL